MALLRRATLWALILGATTMLLAPAALARDPLVLKVYQVPDPRDTDVRNVAELMVVQEFLKRHPHLRLSEYMGVSIEGMSGDTKPLMAIAAGQAPDVLYVTLAMTETYISQNFLYPLDEFVERLPAGAIAQRVPAPVVPAVQRNGPDKQKHWWAIPFNTYMRVLLYRKDVFQQFGLDPKRPPRDWLELEQYAQRLTRPDKGTYGLWFGYGQAAWDWLGFLYAAGGDAVIQDADGQWRAAFDNDTAVETLLYYARLAAGRWTDASGKIQRGYACRSADALQKWMDAKIAMRLTYTSARVPGTGDPELTGFGPVPRRPGTQGGSELFCLMMGIFSDIKPRDGYSADEIRQAAWDYIWFINSKDARHIRTKFLVEQGGAKYVNPEYLKEFGYEECLGLFPQESLDVFRDAVRRGKPQPYGKNCHMIYLYIAKAVDRCLSLADRDQLGRTDDERRQTIRTILHEEVDRTNREMIGLITPEERRKRNNVAFIVAVCAAALFVFVLRSVWRIFTPAEAQLRGGWQIARYKWAYVIMFPAVASILLWQYYPMFLGSRMVFQDYGIVGESRFVGLKNLADVLWDATWWASLARTLYYMLLVLGLGFWTPIALAILLAEVSHGRILYRVLFYLPAVLSGMVVIYLWKLLYDPSDTGIFNMLLGKIGLSPQKWLTDERMAMLCCVLPTVWAGTGPGCLIYLAALKSVPDDLYEAADIDGCGFFKKVFYITLPTLKALIIIQFIGAFIIASQSSGFILVLTFGGPNEATKVADLHIFEKAYLLLRFGTAVTMAWLLGVVMLCFTTLQLKRLSRMEFRAAGQVQNANR